MIRKFGHVDAAPARVRELFADLGSWPDWMPGARSLRVVERSGPISVAELDQEALGHRFRSRVETTLRETSLKLRQLSGPFRRWDATWRFLTPPDGRGATVALELDFEPGGILGLLSPAAVIEGRVDRLFAEVLARARQRLERPPSPGEPSASVGEEVILRLLRTPGGLEVRVAARRILLPLRLS